jgi:histidinol phosphatase-like enzyme (inositol monophosphatase family)
MTPQDISEALAFATDAARQAGEFTLQYFQKDPTVEMKSDNTPVTIADRGAEELLRARIEKHFPTHGILGEEFGEKEGSDPARWILDPVDGTFSFVCGVPLYTNLIGLEWEGNMVVGIINAPALGEITCAGRGLGATWNGQPARVSSVTDVSKARISTTSTHLMAKCNREAPYRRLRDRCQTDRGWADAYGYTRLATGHVDVVIDPIMSIWDTAALLPVVTEAGGTLTDWQGNTTHKAPEALATNGHLLPAVLEAIGDEA